MGDDLAAANVNRSYSLSATSIAIFTFVLIFLYPRFASGEVNAVLFQATLIVMGVSTFSFVFATFHYYGSSLVTVIDDAERAWLLGSILLFLDPSLILAVGRASRRRSGVVGALAGVRGFPDPLFPPRPAVAPELVSQWSKSGM